MVFVVHRLVRLAPVTVTIAGVIAGSAACRAQAGLTPAQVAGIDRVVVNARETLDIPAVSVVVAAGGREWFAKGYGQAHLESRTRASADTIYQPGSMSKQFTASAILNSWDLAGRDRFDTETWYGPGRVLCTVLVGTAGYSGISSAANQNGGDGTVLVSTASLNPAKIVLNFAKDPRKPTMGFADANGATAFARVPSDNHSTLAFKDSGPKHPSVRGFVARALRVTDPQVPQWVSELEAFSEAARQAGEGEAFTQGYQNTLVRLTDHFEAPVTDYAPEVFAKTVDETKVDDPLTRVIQEQVFSKVHVYGDNAACRSLLFDTTALRDRVLQPDRTVLVDLRIRREQTGKVFRLLPLGP